VKQSLRGKKVLVVGSKSSGTDMARELREIAAKVYVSDRNYQPEQQTQQTQTQIEQHGNLYLLPGLVGCDTDGTGMRSI
jgi:cation diffusion facilitator CzcD-associated flavoprotein CzcO